MKIPDDNPGLPVPLTTIFDIKRLVNANPQLTPQQCHARWQEKRYENHWLPHDKFDATLRVDPTIREWEKLSEVEKNLFVMHEEEEL